MDEQPRQYAVGYGKPPIETRFNKGQSGNPGGRPRTEKKLVTLLAEALSRRSGFPKADGSWMTQAEAIFAGLVGQASGSDLKAKRLLFDVLIKLPRADFCWSLPKIQLDDGNDDAVAAADPEVDRLLDDGQRTAAQDRMPEAADEFDQRRP